MLVVLYNKLGESNEEFLGEVHISLSGYKHFKVIDDWYALEDLVSYTYWAFILQQFLESIPKQNCLIF